MILLISIIINLVGNPIPKEISNIQYVGIIVGIIIGIITIISVCIALGNFKGKYTEKIKHLEGDISQNIKPDIRTIDDKINNQVLPALNEIGKGVSFLTGKMEGINLTKSSSPLVLNEKGEKILKDSGIDKIIDNNYSDILAKVKSKNPANAYLAQEIIKDVVKKLINDTNLKNVIEIGALNCGSDIDTVLFVGAIYIRDEILNELNLFPKDIDTFDTSKSK